MIDFFDLWPMSASERRQLAKRRPRLEKMVGEVEKATAKFASTGTPEKLRLRRDFVRRDDGGAVAGDPSDRRLPDPSERPPATRLPSPRGIALQVYLTAMFLAQTRKPGIRPGNTLPLDERDKLSWIDLIATPAERGGTVTSTGVREKKLRTFQTALKRLAEPGIQLLELPKAGARSSTYEGFVLLYEGGAPRGGGDNDRYTVPDPAVAPLLELPAGLFLNGWIHVLEDRELTFLLMIACLRSMYPDQMVFLTGQTRLLEFGIGRDAYQSHHLLRRLGLIDVEEGEDRHDDGRVRNFDSANPPKVHRFKLLDNGFDQPAIDTMRTTIDRQLDPAS
jgi:hypothetical protein